MSSSFDPFDVRMQLLSHLKKLNASQQSIQKVVAFSVKYGSRCGEDLWDCFIEECEKGTLNVRINVLFLLDSLCETSLYVGLPDAPYINYVTRDLAKIVELVVPESREGVLNLLSAKQILESWRTKRVINPDIVDQVLETLERRKATFHVISSSSRKRAHYENFSHADTLRRMEEDRERQKRLRERIWILPIPHLLPSQSVSAQSSSHSMRFPSTPSTDPSPESPFTPASPFTPKTPRELALVGGKEKQREKEAGVVMESALDIEFEQVWETTSELNEDDLRDMEEENIACFDPPARPETLVSDPPSYPPPESTPTPLLSTPPTSHTSRRSAINPSSPSSTPAFKPSARAPPSKLSNEIPRVHPAPPPVDFAPPPSRNPAAPPPLQQQQHRPPPPIQPQSFPPPAPFHNRSPSPHVNNYATLPHPNTVFSPQPHAVPLPYAAAYPPSPLPLPTPTSLYQQVPPHANAPPPQRFVDYSQPPPPHARLPPGGSSAYLNFPPPPTATPPPPPPSLTPTPPTGPSSYQRAAGGYEREGVGAPGAAGAGGSSYARGR